MKSDQALLEALAALEHALTALGAPHMIIGGIAVIARGVPRHTDDVDATVFAEDLELRQILSVLGQHHIVGRIPDVLEFAEQRQVLLLRHEPTRTPMEVSIAWLPFERQAIARAEEIDFKLVRAPVAQPEDLVIYKAIAWRDRDRADIERLLTAHRNAIDLDNVRAQIATFAEALDEPERVAEFNALAARALGKQKRPGRRK